MKLSEALKERLYQETLGKAKSSALGTIALLALLVLEVVRVSHATSFFWLSSAFILISNVMRLWIVLSKHKHSQMFFSITVIGSAIGWCMISTDFFQLSDTNSESLVQVMLLIMGGIASASVVSLSSSPYLLRLFLVLTLIAPVSIAYLNNSPHVSPIVFTLFLLFFVFLVQQSKTIYKSICNRFDGEMSLIDEKNLFKTIIDTVPGYLSYLDTNFKYLAVNHRLSSLFNLEEKDFIGKQLGFLQENNVALSSAIQRFSASPDKQLTIELNIPLKDEKRWHMVSLSKTQDSCIVCVAIDIQHQKEMEEEAINQRRIAEQASKMAALGEVSSGIAHEINNPLAVINAKSYKLARLESIQVSDLHEDAKIIQKMVGRISKIVKGLKTLSRDPELDDFQEQSISEVVDETLSFCKGRFTDKGIDFEVRIEEGLHLECHPTQISQVLLNLLNNAHDAVKELDEKWVKLSIQGNGDFLEIRVMDSGKGIPANIRDKILQPFFTTKGVGEGTGLGLSISASIIRNHGGKLMLDEASPNTTFLIKLPRLRTPISAAS